MSWMHLRCFNDLLHSVTMLCLPFVTSSNVLMMSALALSVFLPAHVSPAVNNNNNNYNNNAETVANVPGRFRLRPSSEPPIQPLDSMTGGGIGGSTTAKSSGQDRPSFRLESNSSLVTSAGQTAYLHCLVENLGERAVSWIRRSDLKILTIGSVVYTQDKRFSSIHERGSEVWILKLVSARVEDSGDYECQLAYHDDLEKKMTMPFRLKVLDSRAHIHDAADLHVQAGSSLNLECSVVDASARPDFVYWYRNGDVLNYSPSVRIAETLDAGETGPVSTLAVTRLVRKLHAGNYTCAPSNARPASIVVHVVDDENGPAAMQHGNASPSSLSSRAWVTAACVAWSAAIGGHYGGLVARVFQVARHGTL